MVILSKSVDLLFLPHKFFNFRISSKHIAIASSILFFEAVLNLLLLLTIPKTELMVYIFERSASLIDKQSIERIVDFFLTPLGNTIFIVYSLIAITIGVFVNAILIHVILLFLGGEGSFKEVASVVLYSQMPLLLSKVGVIIFNIISDTKIIKVPLYVTVLFLTWSLFIKVAGISRYHKTSKIETFFACGLALAIELLISDLNNLG